MRLQLFELNRCFFPYYKHKYFILYSLVFRVALLLIRWSFSENKIYSEKKVQTDKFIHNVISDQIRVATGQKTRG